MSRQQLLFSFPKPRMSNGRFCTKEQLRVERVDNENKLLRNERDMYKRMWESMAKKASRLERELSVLKSKIKDLV